MERTCVLLKPDAVHRRLVGEIIGRFERRGFRIAALKLMRLDRALCERFYEAHVGKEFYERLVAFMSSGPVVAVCLEGRGAIEVVRGMLGRTFGAESAPGTIRGDFGLSNRYNLVHASDTPENARRELSLIFADGDYVDFEPSDLPWVYDLTGEAPV